MKVSELPKVCGGESNTCDMSIETVLCVYTAKCELLMSFLMCVMNLTFSWNLTRTFYTYFIFRICINNTQEMEMPKTWASFYNQSTQHAFQAHKCSHRFYLMNSDTQQP